MAWSIEAQLTGLKPVLARLDRMKKGLRNKILRRAIGKASRELAKKAKAAAPVDDGQTEAPGLYKKSIGAVIATEKGIVIGRIGARRGFKRQVRMRLWGKKAGQPLYQDPAKIGHLVEYGHGGPSPAPPHPHLRPVWDAGRQEAERTIAREIEAALLEEARK